MGKLLTNTFKATSWKTKPGNTCGKRAALYLMAALYLKAWYFYLTAPILLPVARATTQHLAAISELGCYSRAAAPPFSKALQGAKQRNREGTRRVECDRAKGKKSRGYCTHSTALPRKQCPNTAGEGATARRHGVNSGSGLRAAGAPWRGRAGSEAPAAGGAGAATREPTTAARKWGDPCRPPPPPPPALAPFALSSGPDSPPPRAPRASRRSPSPRALPHRY